MLKVFSIFCLKNFTFVLAFCVLGLMTSSTVSTSVNASPIVTSQTLNLNFDSLSFLPEANRTRSDSNLVAGFTWRYENVATIAGQVIDARVTIVAQSGNSGVELDTFDEYDNSQHLSAHTQVNGSSTTEAMGSLRVDFLADNTNTPVVLTNIRTSIADIDAWEFTRYDGVSSYRLSSPTDLTVSTPTTGSVRFESTTSGTSNTDEKRLAEVAYDAASSITVRFGCKQNAVNLGAGSGGKCGFTVVIGTVTRTSATSEAAVTPATYTLTYSANQGTGTVPAPTSGSGALTIESNTGGLVNGGDVFNSWNTSADGSGLSFPAGATFVPFENLTLYAQYGAPIYTVTFDSNGGSGSMTAQTGNTATSLTSNVFTRSGYTFTGWNTAADGSGAQYVDGVSYPFTADLTLYAQWTPDGKARPLVLPATGGFVSPLLGLLLLMAGIAVVTIRRHLLRL